MAKIAPVSVKPNKRIEISGRHVCNSDRLVKVSASHRGKLKTRFNKKFNGSQEHIKNCHVKILLLFINKYQHVWEP